MVPHLETALPAGVDPRAQADLLQRVHEATLSGRTPPARLRPVIEDSWGRVRQHRVDPDRGRPAPVLRYEEIQRHRQSSPLVELVPMVRQALGSVAEDARHVVLITDHRGRLLWRDGPKDMRRLADGAGLVEGSSWDEGTIGTNAIGTALVVGRPLQVYSAEHYVRGLHQLTCACSPVVDPRDGRMIGAIDVTGPVSSVHPSTLALVDTVAKLAESHLRGQHHAHLERLRVVAAPLLAGLREPAIVVDDDGWTAAAARMEPVRRVLLPPRPENGMAWLPSLGECRMEPLPGGWLIRPTDTESAPATEVVLELRRSTPSLTVIGASGEWTHRLTLRHAELLFLLARCREGCSAAQLAEDLFGDPQRMVTVRAEMSRLRRHLGSVIESRPYRFNRNLRVSVRTPDNATELIPASQAPGIRRARQVLAEPATEPGTAPSPLLPG